MPTLVAKKAFLAGVVCRKQGWFVHHAPSEPPGPGLQWRFWIGDDVGRRARDWLGAGTMLRRTPQEAAIAESREAVATVADELLFEATFAWNGLVARADALRAHGSEWDLIEIKSGKTSDDGKVSSEYLDDIAYTRMVLSNAGVRIARALLVMINRDYRLGGAAPLFAYVDVSDQSRDRAKEYEAIAADVAQKAAADDAPPAELIFDCRNCDFFETQCVGRGIPDPLFVIPRISSKKFEALKRYERVSRLPADADLTAIQRGVVDVIQAGEPKADLEGLMVLDSLATPLRYLDFEAIMPHIPWFEGSAPYETVPFQYSVHYCSAVGEQPMHFEYLAPLEGDWRRELVEKLIRDLGDEGSIVVYSGYEKGRLRALAETFPEYAPALNAIIERLFDLEAVFKKGYQHPEFLGRTSIKKVLPVMVPTLSYAALPVNNGDDALGVFGLMRVGQTDADAAERQRGQLLEYCGLDTMAMVRLHLAVWGVAKRKS